MVVTEKKDGSIRICLDARELNKRLKNDYVMPEGVDEILQKCHKVKQMSSLDLKNSFWQVPLSENSKKYTAFIVSGKVYEYNSVPFGLSIATSALLRALDYKN